MVLALSDSRSRHKYNLEKERTRSAQELMRVERAHTKTVTGLIKREKELASDWIVPEKEIKNTLTEAKNIRSWLDLKPRSHSGKSVRSRVDSKNRKKKRIKALQDFAKDGRSGQETPQTFPLYKARWRSIE
ncbi:unnamed protein product, partial [Iphiclides podalirius]